MSPAPTTTHLAGYHASVVLRSALFRLPARVNYDALPWATYTEPNWRKSGWARRRRAPAMAASRCSRGPLTPMIGPSPSIRRWAWCGLCAAQWAGCRGRDSGARRRRSDPSVDTGDRAALADRRAGDDHRRYPTFGDLTRSTAGEFYTPSFSTRAPAVWFGGWPNLTDA